MKNLTTINKNRLLYLIYFSLFVINPFSSYVYSTSFLSGNIKEGPKDENNYNFQVVTLSMSEALKRLETKYNISIAYRSEVVKGLSCDFTIDAFSNPEEHLKNVLQNTGLSYKKNNKDFYIIFQKRKEEKQSDQMNNQENEFSFSKTLPQEQISEIRAEIKVKGNIVDENAMPLPSVTIFIKGTTQGTTTDINGNYELIVQDKNAILVFSFIGYENQEIAVGAQNIINVKLMPESQQLSEVVVTALGVKKEERSLGYAVQKVDTKGIAQARETNVVNSLSGRISGVQVQGSGNFGGSSRLLIRGASSITGENQPLFVVDGTPINNSSFNASANINGAPQESGNNGRDYGNVIQDINPNDIESITVLKGPTAAALYGSRGANGVIQITTKRGKKMQGLGIEVNSSTMFNSPMRLPNYQNEYGGGGTTIVPPIPGFLPGFIPDANLTPSVLTFAPGSWGARMEGQDVRHWDSYFLGTPEFGETRPFVANPDNVRDFFETGVTQSTSVAFSNAGENYNFRVGYTNLYQEGTLPKSELNRHNFNINGSVDLGKRLTATVSANFINNNVVGRPPTGESNVGSADQSVAFFLYSGQRQWDFNRMRNYSVPGYPDRPALFVNFNSDFATENDFQFFSFLSPYFVLNESFSEDERSRLFGNVSLAYKVNDNITLQGFARTDFYANEIRDRKYHPYIGQFSSFSKIQSDFSENNFEFLGSYQKTFNGKFDVSANLGANHRKERTSTISGITNNGLSVEKFYNLANSKAQALVQDFTFEKVVNSIYGTASFGYNGTFFIEGSLRNDWSSTLPLGNNSFLYPSVSSSIVFSELLFPESKVVSFAKVRAGWAQVGNDTDPYQISRVYDLDIPFNGNTRASLPRQDNNQNLKPEITSSYEVGLDLRFFNGRINADFTYYDSETRNQIVPVGVTGATGFVSAIRNSGVMSNRGVEAQITATPIKSKFTWEISVNASRNINKLERLDTEGEFLTLASNQGVTLVAQEGQPYGTFYGNTFMRNENGKRIVANDGFYTQSSEQGIIGNLQPDFNGGILNSFRYKNISMSFLIDFQKGGDFYSVSIRDAMGNGMLEETTGNNALGNPIRNPVSEGGGILAEGVNTSGERNTTYVNPELFYNNSALGSIHEEWMFDASYIKFRELNVGYSLPNSIVEKIGFQSAYLGVVARNLGLLYASQDHIDPSQIALASGNIQGYDVFSLPSERSIGFNINLKF